MNEVHSLRPSFDEVYLKVAKTISERADCTRSKVGAVLVSEDHRTSLGYNGAPSKMPGCLTEGACPRGRLSYEELPALNGNYNQNCIAIHAERNAILRSAPEMRIRATLYVTRSPCRDCQLFALNNGIIRFVWYTPDNKMASMRIIH